MGYRSLRNPPAEEGRNPQRLYMDLDTYKALLESLYRHRREGQLGNAQRDPLGASFAPHATPHRAIPSGALRKNPGGSAILAGLFWVLSPLPSPPLVRSAHLAMRDKSHKKSHAGINYI